MEIEHIEVQVAMISLKRLFRHMMIEEKATKNHVPFDH